MIRDWLAQRRYGTGTVPDFIALAEQHAGRDLTAFFDLWLFQRASRQGRWPTRPSTGHQAAPTCRAQLIRAAGVG